MALLLQRVDNYVNIKESDRKALLEEKDRLVSQLKLIRANKGKRLMKEAAKALADDVFQERTKIIHRNNVHQILQIARICVLKCRFILARAVTIDLDRKSRPSGDDSNTLGTKAITQNSLVKRIESDSGPEGFAKFKSRLDLGKTKKKMFDNFNTCLETDFIFSFISEADRPANGVVSLEDIISKEIDAEVFSGRQPKEENKKKKFSDLNDFRHLV